LRRHCCAPTGLLVFLAGRREAHPAHRDLVRPSDRWSLPPLPRLVFSSLPLLLRNDTHDSTGRTWPIPWLRSIDRPPAPCQLLIITLVGPYGFWLAGPGRRPSVTCRARASTRSPCCRHAISLPPCAARQQVVSCLQRKVAKSLFYIEK
jgi:hypothetical protein